MSTGFATEAGHIRDIGGLSAATIARATGADETTARAWVRGSRAASGRYAERLAELSALVERLTLVMEREYIAVWMIKPIGALGDDKPADVIASGRYRDVSRLIAALETSAMS